MIMNKKILELSALAASTDHQDISMTALTQLGLLVERHTQNRYTDTSYEFLFESYDLYHLKLEDEDVNYLVKFFFYHIINIHQHPVTVAWCLGKCYNQNIYEGIKRLLMLFKDNDDLCEQLLFSLNALYDPRFTYKDISEILKSAIKTVPLPKCKMVLTQNLELLNSSTN